MGMVVERKKLPSRNIIGRRVKTARLQFDPPLTQDQLSGRLAAEGVELDRVALAKVEIGIRCAFDYEVRGLAKALKVDVNWLLGMDADTPQSRTKSVRSRKRCP
jgi:hypothetical protein